MHWFFWMLLAVLIVYIGLLVYRAVQFKPRRLMLGSPRPSQVAEMPVGRKLSELIQVPTVSYADPALEDREAFQAFPDRLHSLFPRVAESCARVLVGDKGIIYRWPGQRDEAPCVLMSHWDVVPAERDKWSTDPFGGDIRDGAVWGRGALDTKCTLVAALEAAEMLLEGGFTPRQDVYFCFAGDEEVAGQAAPMMLQTLQEWGVTPAFVLDEGGALTRDGFPGVKELCALVGVAEKGMCKLDITAYAAPGHASTPPRHTALGLAAKVVTRLERWPWPIRLTPPVRALFDTLGRQGSFRHRLVFANLDLLKPFVWLYTAFAGGPMAAMLRTTCAFTMAQASHASNVLPSQATVSANVRILPGETVKSVRRRAARVLRSKRYTVEALHGVEPSTISISDDAAWHVLEEAIRDVWPEALTTPSLMTACTDARHYHSVCEHVYRFSALELTRQEEALVHGHDERIALAALTKMTAFYQAFITRF